MARHTLGNPRKRAGGGRRLQAELSALRRRMRALEGSVRRLQQGPDVKALIDLLLPIAPPLRSSALELDGRMPADATTGTPGDVPGCRPSETSSCATNFTSPDWLAAEKAAEDVRRRMSERISSFGESATSRTGMTAIPQPRIRALLLTGFFHPKQLWALSSVPSDQPVLVPPADKPVLRGEWLALAFAALGQAIRAKTAPASVQGGPT